MGERKSLEEEVLEAIEERLESLGVLLKVQIIDSGGYIDGENGAIHFEVDLLLQTYKQSELNQP